VAQRVFPDTAAGIEDSSARIAGELSTEGLLDSVAHLGSCLEAAGGDLTFEEVELARLELAQVAFVLQGAEGLESATLVEFQPVVRGARTDPQELSNLVEGQSLVQPEQGRETVLQANVFLFATELFNPLA
jgi:hypothetical protein